MNQVSRPKKLTNKTFTLAERLRSVGFAVNGVRVMLRSQHNAWIHALATIVVVLTSSFFGLSSSEWCWIVLAIITVWTAEALNTAFEFLADAAQPEYHPLVGQAKDVAAAAVLISAAGALAIALLILGPHFLDLFGHP